MLYYDEPDRKLKYKYESDCVLMSVMSECTVNASLVDTIFLFAELDFYKEWMPNMSEVNI